jgi:O-antigen/teichoic acid export membrane protein
MPEVAIQSAEPKGNATFFRQSGWLMIANIGAGGFMWVVHFLSRVVGPTEYGVYIAFLSLAMVLPTFPLQMVLAQQTAKALAEGRQRELAGIIRLLWLITFLVWFVGAVLMMAFRQDLLAQWKVADSSGLWLTILILLLSLWLPLFWGALQGKQDFLCLGWSMILNGGVRLCLAGLAVYLGARAVGMLGGVLIGLVLATGLAIWQTRSLWSGPSAPFDWRGLLKQILPLVLASGAFQVLFTADTLFAKSFFDPDTVGFYGSAGTLARALMWLVGPLAAVMFPRLVHSAAKAEKNNLMNLVLLGTAVLSILGAILVSLLGPLLIRFVSGEKFVAVASILIPWYAFAMVPLAMSNVLLNNLFAKADFRAAAPLVILAIGYTLALTRFHATPVVMLQTMGVFNTLMFSACAWFTWAHPQSGMSGQGKA